MCRHFALGGLLGVLVMAAQVGPARAYACTSDADCGYEGCNDVPCSGPYSQCNNGVWDAACSSRTQQCFRYEYYGGAAADTGPVCPDPPAPSTEPPTTAEPKTGDAVKRQATDGHGERKLLGEYEEGEGAYNCTSDADCQYEGCNDVSCTCTDEEDGGCVDGFWTGVGAHFGGLVTCNNGVWDAICYQHYGQDYRQCRHYVEYSSVSGYRELCPAPATTPKPDGSLGYACTSDADCQYEGCNEKPCSGYEHVSVCNNGVWDAFCYPPDNGHCHAHNGQAMGPYDRCPEPNTTSADPTTAEPATTPKPTTQTQGYDHYACTSDAECQYEGCNDLACSPSSSPYYEAYCNNGVWDAKCWDAAASDWAENSTGTGRCLYVIAVDYWGVHGEYFVRNYCPDPPVGWVAQKPTTTPVPTFSSPAPGCEPVEKFIYKSWQEDPGRKDWGRPGHGHCVQPYTWEELVDGYKGKHIPFKVGGLGKRLEPGGYQTWVCLLDSHPCGDPHYCWVYHETDKVFTPWGTNAELGLHFIGSGPGSGSW